MFQVFEGTTADEAWLNIAAAFRAGGGVLAQASRNGPSREILRAAISINKPRERWVVSRNPPLNIAFALAEVIWIMAGRNDSAFLNYFTPSLPKYAGGGLTYHGAYGHRLRKHLNVDQLVRAYSALRNNPESRQVVLQIWDSRIDLPANDGCPAAEDIPCNVVALLKIRSGALEWTQVMRSNDIFRGLPYNIVQFTSVQEIMAGWLDVKVGSYNHLSDSLHVYESDLQKVDSFRAIDANENVDSLALPKTEFDSVLAELERRSIGVIDEAVTGELLLKQIEKSSLTVPYRNILCVVCAEGARRRQRHDLIDQIMSYCTNPAYQQLYTRWLSRFSGP